MGSLDHAEPGIPFGTCSMDYWFNGKQADRLFAECYLPSDQPGNDKIYTVTPS